MTRTRDPFLFGKGSCEGLDVLCRGIAGAMRMRHPMPRGLLARIYLRRERSRCWGVLAVLLIPEGHPAADECPRKALSGIALWGQLKVKVWNEGS